MGSPRKQKPCTIVYSCMPGVPKPTRCVSHVFVYTARVSSIASPGPRHAGHWHLSRSTRHRPQSTQGTCDTRITKYAPGPTSCYPSSSFRRRRYLLWRMLYPSYTQFCLEHWTVIRPLHCLKAAKLVSLTVGCGATPRSHEVRAIPSPPSQKCSANTVSSILQLKANVPRSLCSPNLPLSSVRTEIIPLFFHGCLFGRWWHLGIFC